MDIDGEQQFPNQNSDQLFVSPTPIKVETSSERAFDFGEVIDLLLDKEGSDDSTDAINTSGSSHGKRRAERHIPVRETNFEATDRVSNTRSSVFNAEITRKALERQRQMAKKARSMNVDAASNDDGAQQAIQGFEEIKQAYFKKKKEGKLSIEDEISFMKAESAESARRRKQEADEDFDRSEDDGEEGVFVKETSDIPNYTALHSSDDEQEALKRRGRKRQAIDDEESDRPRKRRNPTTSAKKGTKLPGNGFIEADQMDVMGQASNKKGAKSKKQKTTKGKRVRTEPVMTNVSSLRVGDIFHDAAVVADRPDQPEFGPQERLRKDALKKLIASVPMEDRGVSRDDMRYLNAAIGDFTGQGSVTPAEDGSGWHLKGLRSTLRHYQVLGGAFMRKREGAAELVKDFSGNAKTDADGKLTNERWPNGGILADEMGLGKTVMMLANIVNGKQRKKGMPKTTLIVASPALVTQWFDEIRTHCIPAKDNPKHGIGRVIQHRAGNRIKSDDTKALLEEAEIVLTTYTEVLKSYPKAEVPIELVTAAQKDTWWREFYEENRGLLHEITWHRIVLDEATAIKNHTSYTSLACRALTAQHYWAITGTPVMNTVKEFYPYFKFIREENTSSYKQFKMNFAATPDDPDGIEKLNVLLRRVMIRRTHKDLLFNAKLLSLPQPKSQIVWLEFNEIERQIYEIVKKRFIERINTISKENNLEKQYSHIWTMLLRLRQLCSHILLIQGTVMDLLHREDVEKLCSLTLNEDSMNEEGESMLIHLRDLFQSNLSKKTIEGDLESSVCIEKETLPPSAVDFGTTEGGTGGKHGLSYHFSKYLKTLVNSEEIIQRTLCCSCRQQPQSPIVTSCFHIYCESCLNDLKHLSARRGRDQARCSECGDTFTSSQPCELDTFQDRDTTPKTKNSSAWVDLPGEVLCSAKTTAVKAQILNWLEEDDSAKIIVYSQFLTMIRILTKVCKTEGWDHCTYTGNMTHDARHRAISDFSQKEGKRILLCSLHCGGLGLNLTSASRVICLEPWWNRSLEQQAFCRVYRIGQTRETKMLRLVIKNSIDATLMAMKERKQVEIDQVMESKDKKLTIQELMGLFGRLGEDAEGRPFIFPSDEGFESGHPRRVADDEDEEQFMGNEA